MTDQVTEVQPNRADGDTNATVTTGAVPETQQTASPPDHQTDGVRRRTQSSPAFRDLLTRLDRLIESILDGTVVPFVGAGISVAAQVPYNSEFRPTVQYMASQLERKLNDPDRGFKWKALLENCHKSLPAVSKMRLEAQDNREPPSKIEHDVILLDRLAELHTQLLGHSKTVEALDIELFAKLDPLPAHYYLACFAREGLVREIISTNYDTCIEEAFKRTFPEGTCDRFYEEYQAYGPPVLSPESDLAQSPLGVIRNLEEYRFQAARRNTRPPLRRPRLLLYKINGCARRYRDSKERNANQIILTERQLQDLRGRDWVRDLLRNTARSRVMLFSGFGSDEPQIRHTILLLIEEFRNSPAVHHLNCDDTCAERLAEFPNAPFVSAFELHLSYSQVQILNAFAEAHLKSGARHKPKRNAIFRFTEERSASGRDWKEMLLSPDTGSEERLPADIFFGRLFQRTWGRLLDHYSDEASPFGRWLASLEATRMEWRLWRARLLAWLYPDLGHTAGQGSSHDGQTYDESAFGRFYPMLDLTSLSIEGRKITERPPLWHWMHAMTIPAKSDCCIGADPEVIPYPCLREDSLRILTALFLLFLLFGDTPSDAVHLPANEGNASGNHNWWCWLYERVRINSGAPGLEVRLLPLRKPPGKACQQPCTVGQEAEESGAAPQPLLVIYLVDDDAPVREGAFRSRTGIIYQVAIPNLRSGPEHGRMRWGSDSNVRRFVSFQRIPLEHLVKHLLDKDQEEEGNPPDALRAGRNSASNAHERYALHFLRRIQRIRWAFASYLHPAIHRLKSDRGASRLAG